MKIQKCAEKKLNFIQLQTVLFKPYFKTKELSLMNNIILKPKGKSLFFFPKKNHPHCFLQKRKLHFLIFFFALLFSFFPKKGITQCSGTFSCIAGVNISAEEHSIQLQFENSTKRADKEFTLYPNTPNPFAKETSINFHLPKKIISK